MKNKGSASNFYEDLTNPKHHSRGTTKKGRQSSSRRLGLSEEQISKLRDDLRRPMKGPSSASNPLQ